VEAGEATGLTEQSRIMVDKVTTMPRDNVHDHLGRLSDADLVRLDRALIVFLGLAE
jgi:mRNA interferase MazF